MMNVGTLSDFEWDRPIVVQIPALKHTNHFKLRPNKETSPLLQTFLSSSRSSSQFFNQKKGKIILAEISKFSPKN